MEQRATDSSSQVSPALIITLTTRSRRHGGGECISMALWFETVARTILSERSDHPLDAKNSSDRLVFLKGRRKAMLHRTKN